MYLLIHPWRCYTAQQCDYHRQIIQDEQPECCSERGGSLPAEEDLAVAASGLILLHTSLRPHRNHGSTFGANRIWRGGLRNSLPDHHGPVTYEPFH